MTRTLTAFTALWLAASSIGAQELFVSQKSLALPSFPGAVLEAEVAVEFSLLLQGTEVLGLTLPDGDYYRATLTDFEQRAGGDVTWRGSIPRSELELAASVTLTVYDHLLVGTITTPEGTYEIRPRPDRSHRLMKVERTGLRDCAGAVVPPRDEVQAASAAAADLELAELDPAEVELDPKATARLDVLAIYSADARASVGGHSQIRALIQHLFDTANSAFANSSAAVRVSLRHAQEMPISPSRFQDLSYLRTHGATNDLRDAVGADLVAAFIRDADNYCGIGYLMDSVSSGFAPWAYSITDIECSTLVLAHEVGHNLGLNHDPANRGSSGSPSFPWAFGHYVDQVFRTVMSYSTECTAQFCPRIPNFSHPGLFHSGHPTGIPGERNNRKVLNATAPVGANFRPTAANINAAFTYSPARPAFDLPVQFTDQSTGSPDSWSWSFGDGSSSSAQNPSHIYSQPGIYTVSLTVSRSGASDSTATQVEVEDIGAGFTVGPASPRVEISTFFLDASTGSPTSWSWDFGDGATSEEANPSHTFATPGTYTVGLTVSRDDIIDTLSSDVEVRARTCADEAKGLCLSRDRFHAEVEWTDFEDRTGVGSRAPLVSDDSGMFWFFDGDNWEMLVKVLDGCGFNDRFWVFAAATTDVGYTLRITDTYVGEVHEYLNPVGTSAPAITDTDAFATCDVTAGTSADFAPRPRAIGSLAVSEPTGSLIEKGDCSSDGTQLCLNGDRFLAEVTWRDFEDREGSGTAVVGTEDSGLYWFFSDANWELLIKVLDGCGLNDHFWVFAAATTNVEYTLKVTDLESGRVKEYRNPLGVAASAITDTGAFATCP